MTDENKIIEEVENLLTDGDNVNPDVARRLQLSISLENHKELKKINGRLKKVEAAEETWEENPSLLWYLRFETKKTVATILFVFVLLSALYVSGIRAPILEFFGLPPLLP
jgi:hypothetical protein